MTDQVGFTGSLASGLPVALSASGVAGVASGRDGSAKIADPSALGPGSPAQASPTGSPDRAVEQINSHLQQASSQLQLQVDSETGRTIYRIVDPTTGQVVLQVPSVQVLAMAHSLQAMDKKTGTPGVLVDKNT
jgi:FlaG protein